MPRRFQKMLPFHPSYDFQVFKAFTFDGHDLKGGDPFPPEGSTPADTVLEKLYRQKFITLAAEAPSADEMATRVEPITPVRIDTKVKATKAAKADRKAKAREATAAAEAAKAAEAKAAESSQGDASDKPADAPTEGTANAETDNQTPADDASQSGGADDGRGPAGADADAADAGLKPHHAGLGKWQVRDASGKVLAEDLTKAEAYKQAGVPMPTKAN